MPDASIAINCSLVSGELNLSRDFSIGRGQSKSLGSSTQVEISVPLLGVAERECEILLDDFGILWLIRDTKEQSIRIDLPAYFNVGPYRFLLRELVNLTESDLGLNPELKKSNRKFAKTGAALLFCCSIVAGGWFAITWWTKTGAISQEILRSNSHSRSAELKEPRAEETVTEINPEKGIVQSPLIDNIMKLDAAAASSNTSAPESPREESKMDLEALAKTVSPCVLRIDVIGNNDSVVASGTGFAVSSEGFVATNYHVVKDGVRFELFTQQGAKFDSGWVVAEDPNADLAMLKVDSKSLPFLNLAASSDVAVGKRVAVFGSPKGLGGTLSDGIISATPKDLKARLPKESLPNGGVLLQTTAAVSHGSSGSPLFDSEANVVGVMTAILQGSDQPQNLNFAVPVEALASLLSKAKEAPLVNSKSFDTGHGIVTSPSSGNQAEFKDVDFFGDPTYTEFLRLSGKGLWVEAMKLARILVDRYPKVATAHFNYAYCSYVLSLYRQAEESFRVYLKMRPNDASGWYNLGLAMSSQDDVARSLGAFEQAAALKPDYAESWSRIVVGNVVLNNWRKASSALVTLDQVNSTSAKDMARFLSRYRISDPEFKQILGNILSKKIGNVAKDGPVRARVVGVRAGETLSIRSGPGTTFAAVTAVAANAEMFIVGKSELNGSTEWVPVEIGNLSGWVSGKFLKPTD